MRWTKNSHQFHSTMIFWEKKNGESLDGFLNLDILLSATNRN